MDSRILQISPALLLAMTLVSPACAAASKRSAPSDRQAIIALENEWIAAKEAATLERLLADDFLHPVYTGDILNKAQNIDWLVKHPRPADRHARFIRLDVRLFGGVAQAYGTASLSEARRAEHMSD